MSELIVQTEDYKISADKLQKVYYEAIGGAKKIITLGIVAECAYLERPQGTYMQWVKDNCQLSYGTISNARRAVKRILGESTVFWSTILALPDPSLLLSLDSDRLVPRLQQIQKKLLDACEGKTTQQMEYQCGIRKDPSANGHATESEIEEIARKRNEKPDPHKPIDPVKRIERIMFGGHAETQQKTALSGKIRELLDIDTRTIKQATTAIQRRNMAERLRALADKLEG